jgi:hypothetical protein
MTIIPFIRTRPRGRVNVPTVTLAHGGGGKAMKDLIDDVFVGAFDNATLAPLEDQARFDLAALAAHGDRLAFTTDSFVVDPLIFPGGDIGKLAVCGTVNDLPSAAPGRSISPAASSSRRVWRSTCCEGWLPRWRQPPGMPASRS